MVIAERNKKIYIPVLILGAGGIVLAILASESFTTLSLVTIWIINVVLSIIAIYGILIPKEAIVKNKDCFIINYLFFRRVIPIDKIESVIITERGEFYHRNDSIISVISFFSDMRRLTINYKENDILCHSSVLVKNATAVKCSIDTLINHK